MKPSLRSILLIPVAVVILVAMAVAGAFLHTDLSRHFQQSLRSRAEVMLYSLRYVAETSGQSPSLSRFTQALAMEKDVASVIIVTDDGNVVAASRLAWRNQNIADIPELEHKNRLLAATRTNHSLYPVEVYDETRQRLSVLLTFQMLPRSQENTATEAAVIVELDARPAAAAVHAELQRLLTVLSMSGLAIIFLIYFMLEKQVFIPLGTLLQRLRGYQLGSNLDTPPEFANSELSELGGQLHAAFVAVNDSRQRYALSVEGASVGLWDWNIKEDTMFWSPRFLEMIGVTHGKFVPTLTVFRGLLHPDDYERTLALLDRHLDPKYRAPYDAEYRLRHVSGHYVWIHARGQAFWSDTGQPVRMCGSVDDITSRKKVELELKKSQQELALIFDNVPLCIWQKDADNRIVRLNRTAALFMGGAPSDFEGGSTCEVFPRLAKKYHEDDLRVINSGEPLLNIIEPYTPQGGGYGWLSTDKVPYNHPDTGHRGLLVVAQDITALISAQERLEKAVEQLTHSNEELERFAFVASHDLQEPLRMVSNFTLLLKKHYGDSLDEKGLQYIDFACTAAIRMQNLVSDLLQYARLSSTVDKTESVDMNDMLHFAQQNMQQAVQESGAVITSSKLPVIAGNRMRLSLMLQNLLSNSIKYTRAGITPAIHVDCREEHKSWLFSIRDNGIGMKKEYAEKIFQPFQRLHGKDEYSGTGIGLAIVRKVVDSCGGDVWVESAPDCGSTFFFRLPKAHTVAREQAA